MTLLSTRRRITLLCCAALLVLIGSLPAAGEPEALQVMVGQSSGQNVRVRSLPSTKGEILGALGSGDTIIVAERRDTGETHPWYRIIYPVRDGWVYGQYVQFFASGKEVPFEPSDYWTLFRLSLLLIAEYGYTPDEAQARFGTPLSTEHLPAREGRGALSVLSYPGFVLGFERGEGGDALAAVSVAPGNSAAPFGPWRSGDNARTLKQLLPSYDESDGQWSFYSEEIGLYFRFPVEDGFIGSMAFYNSDLTSDYLALPDPTKGPGPDETLPIERIPDLHRHRTLVHNGENRASDAPLAFRDLQKNRGKRDATALFNESKTLSARVETAVLPASDLGVPAEGTVSFEQIVVRNERTGAEYAVYCPALPHLAIHDVVWYRDRYLLFDIPSDAFSGRHYVVDAPGRSVLWQAFVE